MPPNLEATKTAARHVWRAGGRVYVSFPTLPRAYLAIQKLSETGREAEYDAYANRRHWIRFGAQCAFAALLF